MPPGLSVMPFRFLLCLAVLCSTPVHGQATRPPFEAQLLRLSEILGALHHLRAICGAADADAWRQRMEGVLEGEGADAEVKARLAGAFNRGYRTFSLTYQRCTGEARRTEESYLAEAGRISRDVGSRYAN
jgi:uncharacterized protein (TIGR02301 family)